ncbi:MAG: hypothetical protein OXH53_14455 [bacterium]|nr:hypothetical protein [bacterium]
MGLVLASLTIGGWFTLSRIAPENNGYVEVTAGSEQPTNFGDFQTVSPESSVNSRIARDVPREAGTDVDLTPFSRESTSSQTQEDDVKETSTDVDPTESSTTSTADIALEEIVQEFIMTLWGGTSVREENDLTPSAYDKLDSLDAETRRRGEFELDILVALHGSLAQDPYYPQLYKFMTDSWSSCLKKHGVPPLEELRQLSKDQQDALAKSLGLVGDRMKALEDKCWQASRIFQGKDENTGKLLQSQYRYYMEIAVSWVIANPDEVVPLPG